MKKLILVDALLKPAKYHKTTPSAVDWWIAGAAFFGGTCFVIGSFSGSSQLEVKPKAGLTSAYTWLVYVTFCLGSYLFTLGCFLITVAAQNERFQENYSSWKVQPDLNTRPKYRWLGIKSRSVAWWGGVVYTFGAVLYNIGTTVSLADQFESVVLSPTAQLVLERVTFLVGGVGFLLGGASFVLESKGWRFLEGILVPTSRNDLASLDYWVNWLNFWGGVGFFASGVFGMVPNLDTIVFYVENAIGFGLGSCCFWMGGLLLFVKMSLDQEAEAQYGSLTEDRLKGDSAGSIALSTLSEP
ncbi:hypothetical protein COCSUDRAFT_53379 [Coccomyxa subellipsoidea C-169]|uniref:YrhK domain-containing protein n=1 Tax=Coccomyxa subellipsoidea (strain C-169) TaxID=574566 RepID=I0YYS5_COCSC|nr:hypothetical protein COCSUDRAFT_53379 [Coccomyxa subellipsoidea C-169]EIE23544.1 hypothetical protein COCSUDRAFT_53379 [Coccomyxa subellipsoidea C-169]|eukprot:XP_005648088.1 hypothetical protein COCSUDRAFT_53379 [Coccomyxa subellipsoidea C-169]